MAKASAAPYDLYVRDYKIMAEKMRAKGMKPAETMYSPEEYAATYQAHRQSMKERGLKTPNVRREVIERQKWELTRAQALAYQRVIQKRTKVKPRLDQIRQGGGNQEVARRLLSENYHRIKDKLLKQGYNDHDASRIAHERNQKQMVWVKKRVETVDKKGRIHTKYIWGSR